MSICQVRSLSLVLGLTLFASLACGCDRGPTAASGPGMGELMASTQMRHAKLFFAGQAQNWQLADYEMDELQEGFDDSVRLHPLHKGANVAELLPSLTAPAMTSLHAAIEQRDPAAFSQAFDALTHACNNCHEAANFGFNVVQRPQTNPYTNQRFAPAR